MNFDLEKVFLFQSNNKCNKNCIMYLENNINNNSIYCYGDIKGELQFFEINELNFKLISKKNLEKEITFMSKIFSNNKMSRSIISIKDQLIGFENNGDEFFKMYNDSTEKLIYVKSEENLIYACSEFYLNCFEQKMGESMKNKLIYNSPGKINYLYVHSLDQINYQAILACEDNSIRVVFENQLSYCIKTDYPVWYIEAYIEKNQENISNKKELTKNMLFGLSNGSIICYELFSENYDHKFTINSEKNHPCEKIFSSVNLFGYKNEIILTINKNELNVFIKGNQKSNYFTNIIGYEFEESLISLDKGTNFLNSNGVIIMTSSGNVYSVFNLVEFEKNKIIDKNFINNKINNLNNLIIKGKAELEITNQKLKNNSENDLNQKNQKVSNNKLQFEINYSFEILTPPFINVNIESFELMETIYIQLDKRIKLSTSNTFSWIELENNFYILDITMTKNFSLILNIVNGEDIDLFLNLIIIPNNSNFYSKNLNINIPFFYLNIKSDILEKNSKSCLKIEGSDLFNFFEIKFKYFFNIKLLLSENNSILYFKNLALENTNEFHFKNDNLVEIYSTDLNFLIKIKEILIQSSRDNINNFKIDLDKESFINLIKNFLNIIDDVWKNFKNYQKLNYINEIIEKYPEESNNLCELNNIYKEQNNIKNNYELDQELMIFIENLIENSLKNLCAQSNQEINNDFIKEMIDKKEKDIILDHLNEININ